MPHIFVSFSTRICELYNHDTTWTAAAGTVQGSVAQRGSCIQPGKPVDSLTCTF